MNVVKFYLQRDILFIAAKVIILISLIFALTEYFLGMFSSSRGLSNLYLLQLGFIFAISYITTVRKLGWTHIFSLLQFTTLVFMVSTPLLSPLTDGETIRFAFSPRRETFREEIIQKVLIIFSVYISTSFLVYFSKLGEKRKIRDCPVGLDLKTREIYFKLGKICLITMFPFALSYSLFLLTIGRAELYASGTAELGMPIYIRVANMIYTAGYFMLVASIPSFRQFSRYTLLFFVGLIPTLLSGERGEVLTVVVFYVWYITRFHNKQIKWFVIAILGLLGIVTSYVIAYIRQDMGIETDSLFEIVLFFFSESSTTFKLTSFFVEYGDLVPHNYPYFLDQFVYGFISTLFGLPNAGQSEAMLAVRSGLGHNLVYYLNPDYYLGGNSFGTAWIAECYEFGIIGVVIGATVLVLFVKYFNHSVINNRWLSIFTYSFFSLIIMTPRGSLLPSLYFVVKWSLVVAVLVFVYKLGHTDKYKHIRSTSLK